MSVAQATLGRILPEKRNAGVLLLVAMGGACSLLLIFQPSAVYLAAVGGLVLFVLILLQPMLGFYLTVASIPLEAAGQIVRISLNVSITISKVLAAMTAIAWLVALLTRRARLVWTREMTVFAVIMALAGFSLVFAREFDHGVSGLVRLGSTFGFFILCVNMLRTREQIWKAAGWLVFVSVLTFGFGIVQRYLPGYAIENRASWTDERNITYGVENLTVDPGSSEYIARSSGTNVHSVAMAINAAFTFPLLFAFLLATRRLDLQILIALGILITLISAVLTFSRTGFAMFVIILAYLFFARLIPVSAVNVLILVLVLSLSAFLLPQSFIERVLSPSSWTYENSESLRIRTDTFWGSLNAIRHNPIHGLGIGNMMGIFDYFDSPASHYFRTKTFSNFTTSLNTYLQTAMEIGIPGLLAFLYLFYLVWIDFRIAIGALQRQEEWRMALMARCMLLGFAAILVASFTADFIQGTFKNVWLVMASGVALKRIAAESES